MIVDLISVGTTTMTGSVYPQEEVDKMIDKFEEKLGTDKTIRPLDYSLRMVC